MSFISFIYINIKATFFRLFETLRIVFKYYRSGSFFLTDLSLIAQYLFQNPHQISKRFLKKRGEANIYAYGETPLTSLDKIARECRILSKDVVYDLGCGSGRTSFWLAKFVGCKVIAVDYLPTFIKKANLVKRLSGSDRVFFLEKDMLEINYKEATVVYLYGTCLDDDTIEKLIKKLHSLTAGSKVITVSYPLTDYAPSHFKLEKSFPIRFPWGIADVFLNVKRH